MPLCFKNQVKLNISMSYPFNPGRWALAFLGFKKIPGKCNLIQENTHKKFTHVCASVSFIEF